MRLFLLGLTILHAGCSMPKAGQPLVQSSDSPRQVKVLHGGIYELRNHDAPGEPIVTARLRARETVGFKPTEKGNEIYAMAGSNPESCPDHRRVILEPGRYYWTLAAESQICEPRWKWELKQSLSQRKPDCSWQACREWAHETTAGVTVLVVIICVGALFAWSMVAGGGKI